MKTAIIAKKISQVFLPIWILAHISIAVTFAAQPSSTDTEDQNRRTRQEAEERQQRVQQKDVFLQSKEKTVKDRSLPDEELAFYIKTLVLKGDSVERFPWAQGLLDYYAERKIGIEGIKLIEKRLTNEFIERGYITTRIIIPEQDLNNGVLTFVLLPGRVGEIRIDENSVKQNWRNAFPIHKGNILNLRQLEQGLEQMNRVPSQDVDMQILPGSNSGESDIVISIKATKNWRITISVDDSGTEATGKIQTSPTFSWDNPFGLNDLFTISLSSDGDRKDSLHGTSGDSFYYSIPYGDSTFTFSNYSNRYHQTVAATPIPFSLSGEINNTELGISQLLQRNQSSKTTLEGSIVHGSSRSFIEDTEIAVQHQVTTAAKIGLSHRQYIGKMIFDAAIVNKRGVPWFSAEPDPAAQDPSMPTNRYSIWVLDSSLTMPANLGNIQGRYTVTFHGQSTNDSPFASEFISIGNRYTVRGFDGEKPLSAASGWYLRNDFSIPLHSPGIEAYVGLDYGEVCGPTAQALPGRILVGSVVGLRGVVKNASYDLFVGFPVREPDGYETARHTFGFQLFYQL